MGLLKEKYLPRLLDNVIERRLEAFGAVEVAGAKFCGKTWASMAHAESIVHVDDEAVRQMIEVDVSLALEGDTPHVIDEWQEVPKIWDAVRRSVDARGNKRGQYILTGSSTVDKTKVTHSGAGRIATLRMRPMSLYEAGKSTGIVSLARLFEGECPTAQVEVGVRELADYVCRGGWPASINASEPIIGDLPAQYLQALFEVSAAKQGLDPRMARHVAVSLARNMGKTVTYKTLFGEASQGEPQDGMSSAFFRQAIEPYTSFFEAQYFTEDQRGWDAPVKSSHA